METGKKILNVANQVFGCMYQVMSFQKAHFSETLSMKALFTVLKSPDYSINVSFFEPSSSVYKQCS